jgi:hypothetical protein
MNDSNGNLRDPKVLEINDPSRQEAYAQGWAAAIASMTTAVSRMRHAGTLGIPKSDLSGLGARIEDASGLLAPGGPGGSNLQLQYNDGGAFGGTAGLTWVAGVPTTVATSLQLVNQINDEVVDLVPRGIVSIENSDTDLRGVDRFGFNPKKSGPYTAGRAQNLHSQLAGSVAPA